MAPGIPIIDLFADAPVGNPRASAYLLAAYAAWLPVRTVFLCVVDTGVGGTRPSIFLEADDRWCIGRGGRTAISVLPSAARSRSAHEQRSVALTRRQHSTKQRPHPHRPKPPERRDEPQASTNRRLAEQTRKIMRKHYMSKYRVQ
jgi:hypothetical protein